LQAETSLMNKRKRAQFKEGGRNAVMDKKKKNEPDHRISARVLTVGNSLIAPK